MAFAEPSSNTPLSEMLSTILTKCVWACKSFPQSSPLFPQYPQASFFFLCCHCVSQVSGIASSKEVRQFEEQRSVVGNESGLGVLVKNTRLRGQSVCML